jgi:hypothetical protein
VRFLNVRGEKRFVFQDPARPSVLCFQVWLISRRGLQSKFDFKARGHAVKSLAVDAENFRGAFSIASGRVENVENVALL